jgi:NTE family protein
MAPNILVAAHSDRDVVLIDLGLQGGGSHGAFTWGVLDRLLEVPWLRFDGISATSAGAMNAVVMADGYAAGNPEGARAALEKFWKRVSDGALLSPLRRGPLRNSDRPVDPRLLACLSSH